VEALQRKALMERGLRRVVDALPGLIWTALPDGQIEWLSQYWVHYTGLELDALRGRAWQTAVVVEDLPRLLGQWQCVSPPHVPVETNVRLRSADGSYRWFRFRSQASRIESDQIVQWSGLAIDVDDWVRAEESLRASERRSRLIVDGLPVLLSTSTTDGELEQANRHYLEYFGTTLEELQTREAPHSLHPDDRERVQTARREAIEAGRPYQVECRRRRADGIYRWFYLRAFPLRDGQGRIVQWYRLQIDIEDQKRAEALLAGEKRLLEMVASGRPMSETLRSLCELVERVARGCLCSIVLIDPDGAKLEEAIAPSLPSDFNDAVRSWPLDCVGSPCVMAARDKLQVITPEIATDARWRASWRALAQRHGLRSCWSTPLASQAGKVLGTFALYQREPGTPTPLQLDLIAQFTNIASIAIDRAQRDEVLRRSEARLANAESELRDTLDSIPTITWRARPDGYVQQLNKRWFEYTGTTPEQVRGWRWKLCVHPDDLDRLVDIGREYVATGTPIDAEARLRRHDGTYRWFLFRPSPVRHETGTVTGWYGSITDIEDRKQAEAKLVEAERESRRMLDEIPTLIVRGATNGYIQYLNKQWFEYTGSTHETAKGFRWQQSLHPDDKNRLIEFGARFVASREPGDCEARLRRHDGAYRWFLFRPSPAYDETGTFVGWYGTVTDIEDRKRAEEALAARERDLKLTIETIPGLTWFCRADGRAEFLNKQWQDYTGLSGEDALGWNWTQAVHPDDLPELERRWRETLASDQPDEHEARIRRFDGEYRWFLFRCAPLRNQTGAVVRWYGTNTDIEDRKQAEARLVKAERELRVTLDSIPTMTWRAAPNGDVQRINRQFFDYTGTTPEETQGHQWQSCVHPDDLPGFMAVANANIPAAGRPLDAEARLRRFDGVYRWFMFRVAPLRDETGAVTAWYGTITDIEDRKRIKTQLAGEKHLLEMVASGRPLREVLGELCGVFEKAAPDCFCDVHLIDWINQTFEYGVAPSLPSSYTAPIAGLPLRDDLVPCGIAAHQKIQVIAEDFVSDSRWCTSPVRSHVSDHGLRSVWSTPILSKEGNVLGTVCVYQRRPASPSEYHQELIAHATHIASIAIERSRAEAALKRSETFLAEGQRISRTGSFSWPVERNAITFSEELRRIFEFEPDVFVTLGRLRERTHPDDRALMDDKVGSVRAGANTPEYEIRLMMPDGRIKHVRIIGRLVRHQDGKLECLGAVQDVTQRRLAEEALDKARSELAHVTRAVSLGALTASIAHEVNQPLAGIITNASTCLRMLGADPPNIDGARETARRTIRDGNRAADVITRLRALFSKKAAATETVDLNEATREVLSLVYGDLLRNKVILRAELEDAYPLLVTGDRVQLQQVILNLVRNAWDAMSEVNDRPRDLHIRVDLDQHGRARLTVRDAGSGFGLENAERLFDAFYTTKPGGMGMGLSLSRSIIESHGGKLCAQVNDGAGATFSFSIPRHSASAGDEAVIWTRPTSGPNDSMRNA
jgi:PAS domain S-box-containing protein